MKRMMSLLIVLVISLSFASCEFTEELHVQRYSNNTRLSFSWWGNDRRSKYTIEALKEFEQKSEITVDPQYCEFSGFKGSIDIGVNSGVMPDVVQLERSWLYEYYSGNEDLFYDMNKLKSSIRLGNFTEEQLKLGTIDGKLLGIPVAYNCVYFFYNSDTLNKYGIRQPKNWAELLDTGMKLRSKGVYALEMDERAVWLCCAAYAEQVTGKPMFDENDRIQYSSDEFRIMLDFYKKLIDYNVIPRPSEFNHMDFYNGKAAGIVCLISESKSYFESNTGVDAESVRISLGELPRVDNSVRSGWYKKPMALYCISSSTKEPAKAAKLVDFLLNSEEMAEKQGTEKGVPLSRSAQEVLEARDMLSDLQAVADKKMNEDKGIEIMCPYLENSELMKLFFSAGDDVVYNGADTAKKGREITEGVRKIKEIPE